jgi:phage FluMu gp28-like protein
MHLDPYSRIKLTPKQRASQEAAVMNFRLYQETAFWLKEGLLVLHWARQIGKSYTLAAWAVRRVLAQPGRLVTVLSNSRTNGAEFMAKCALVCERLLELFECDDISPDGRVENMRMEIRLRRHGKTGRILVLAANLRTARGFSGDLILDEFAFHEDSAAIWDAAEPIIASNPDYACRIASTGNGRYNMFYKMAQEGSPYTVSRVRRSEAYKMGVIIYDPATRREITPEEARAGAFDKGSYDQNYECAFNDESMALLSNELISACEYAEGRDGSRAECHVCGQDWTGDALELMRSCAGPLGVGLDVGRTADMTVITVGEKIGGIVLMRGMLRLSGMRLPQQLARLRPVLEMANFGRMSGDATGLGLGLVEFAQELCGPRRAEAVQFASREKRVVQGIEQSDSALVTELMGLDLLEVFEKRAVRVPAERELRESLRKPERITSASGVRIAATRDGAGHADEFWSLALMVRALKGSGMAFGYDASEGAGEEKYAAMDRRALTW